MKKHKLQKYRHALERGVAVFAILFLLLCGTGCHSGKNTDSEAIQPTTTEVTTCLSTTTSTATTTSTTITSAEITTTTTAETILMIQPTVVNPTTAVQIEPTTAWVEPEPTWNNAPISDYERILLNNVVAREYGSDWVSVYDKACVVATVMNRVNSPQFPNTIEGVLTQPSQFSGYYACNYEWSNVTDSVRESVDYYFNHQDEFGSYLYFYGDGTRNYFY